MIVNELTKEHLVVKRQLREMLRNGYEEITMSFGIGKLCVLDRGGRIGWKLVDAVLGASGHSVYVKAVPPIERRNP
jgi:hypothetical protein